MLDKLCFFMYELLCVSLCLPFSLPVCVHVHVHACVCVCMCICIPICAKASCKLDNHLTTELYTQPSFQFNSEIESQKAPTLAISSLQSSDSHDSLALVLSSYGWIC